MRAAVVGHVEWVTFTRVPRLPGVGEIVHAAESWETAAGGGAVTAVQLARLTGGVDLYTALGAGEVGERVRGDLERRGVTVHAVVRDRPQARALTFLDDAGERTITVLGERLEPRAEDPLPWEALAGADAVYLCAGDAGAVRAARRARILVATPRAGAGLRASAVALDALVHSARDPGEEHRDGDLDPPPAIVVSTEGPAGGRWRAAGGAGGRYAAAPVPGDPVDAYGCGDAFAAGLTAGLGWERDLAGALDLAARCGAACLAGRGPYGRLLDAA
jgi:ribokinase